MGIGEAFARRLAAENHNLFLVSRSEEKLKQLSTELKHQHNIQVLYFPLDLSKPGADQLLFEETERQNLQINMLINNAGIGSAGVFTELDITSELAMLNLNILTLVGLTHRYLQKMRKQQKGTIINLASVACFQPIPFMAVYAASKAFVRFFSEALAEENRPYNIKVLTLCPGATETNFFEAAKLGNNQRHELGITQVETPETVVDNALKALNNNKRLVISGFKNALIARFGHIIPNAWITRVLAKSARPFFEKK